MLRRKARHREFVERNFSTIWPAQVAAFTRLMVHLRQCFDGDLDMMLVLAAIGDRTRPENWARELVDYGALTQHHSGSAGQYPLNVQSIAEYTGIPRETVRRKLAALERKGWIARDERGHITATGAASADLSEATRHAMDYLATLSTVFDVARKAPDPAPTAGRSPIARARWAADGTAPTTGPSAQRGAASSSPEAGFAED